MHQFMSYLAMLITVQPFQEMPFFMTNLQTMK
jgi:hypothetical protein